MPETLKPQTPARPAPPNPWTAMAMHWWRAIRNWFHKEQLVNFAKTMTLVGPLTVLIWVYAEREQFLKEEGVPFPIEVRSNDPNRIVRLLTPQEKIVMADLWGPRARLDRLRDQLIPRADSTPITINVDSTHSTGINELNTAEVLSDDAVFTAAGITVLSASPPRLRVMIEQIVEVEARVEVPPTVTNLETPVVFDPPVVKIRGPEEQVKYELTYSPVDNKPVIYVDLSNVAVMKSPGIHENVTEIPLALPPNSNSMEFRPRTVNATLRVRQSDVEYEIRSMPIWVLSPSGDFQDKYIVQFESGEGFLYNVPLIGPREQIEALKRPDFAPTPKAYLEVSRDDTPGVTRSRKLHFDIPGDIKVAPAYADREITFKVIERTPIE